MSALETEQNTEGRASGLLHREFTAELSAGDGRTLDVRIVPYGEPASVNDGDGRGFYQEEFVSGAFDDQLVAGHRLKVWLNFQHERGIGAVVGKGVALREEPDGLYGTFRALDHSDGDKALALVSDGLLDSVSLEFLAKKSVRTAGGIVRRVKAHLDAVALCRQGAYAGAKVLAVREEEIPQEFVLDEDLLLDEPDPELIERCRRLGIQLPQRYEAHPEPDTPADADTSETGTRQPGNDDTEV